SPANLYVYDFDWSPDGKLFAAEAAEGSGTDNYWIAQLYTVRADTGGARSVWKPPLQIACPRFSPDGKTIAVIHGIMSDKGSTGAAVVHSFDKPPEVWAGPIGSWKPLTRENARQSPFWGEARSLHWDSGGATVQGWLLAPRNVEPGRRYPMVVSVHGGPSSASTPGWPVRWNAVLPSQGYFLFLPNPRGSYGRGEAFARANVK